MEDSQDDTRQTGWRVRVRNVMKVVSTHRKRKSQSREDLEGLKHKVNETQVSCTWESRGSSISEDKLKAGEVTVNSGVEKNAESCGSRNGNAEGTVKVELPLDEGVAHGKRDAVSYRSVQKRSRSNNPETRTENLKKAEVINRTVFQEKTIADFQSSGQVKKDGLENPEVQKNMTDLMRAGRLGKRNVEQEAKQHGSRQKVADGMKIIETCNRNEDNTDNLMKEQYGNREQEKTECKTKAAVQSFTSDNTDSINGAVQNSDRNRSEETRNDAQSRHLGEDENLYRTARKSQGIFYSPKPCAPIQPPANQQMYFGPNPPPFVWSQQ